VKRWKRRIRRAALSLVMAAVVVPAAQALPPEDVGFGPSTQATLQQPTRPDDRAGVRAVDGVVLGDAEGKLWGIAHADILANEPGAPISVDRPASSYYTPAALKAMGDRYQAQAESIGLSATRAAVRPDDRGAIRGVEEPPVVAVGESSGLDWRDAGIGALAAFGAVFLAGLTMVAMRRQRVATP
jgi:hypothetical protein